MRSSHGFRTAPIPSGWVQTGERWALWYNGRETASVTPDGGPGVRLWMEGQKMWHTKEARAANIRQAKRYAERWCAARLYPGLPLREAVARLTDAPRSSRRRRFLVCRRPASSSNRPGAWPRPGRRRWSASRQRWNRASRRQRRSPERGTLARHGSGQGCAIYVVGERRGFPNTRELPIARLGACS